jgi:hypothetical protein
VCSELGLDLVTKGTRSAEQENGGHLPLSNLILQLFPRLAVISSQCVLEGIVALVLLRLDRVT